MGDLLKTAGLKRGPLDSHERLVHPRSLLYIFLVLSTGTFEVFK